MPLQQGWHGGTVARQMTKQFRYGNGILETRARAGPTNQTKVHQPRRARYVSGHRHCRPINDGGGCPSSASRAMPKRSHYYKKMDSLRPELLLGSVELPASGACTWWWVSALARAVLKWRYASARSFHARVVSLTPLNFLLLPSHPPNRTPFPRQVCADGTDSCGSIFVSWPRGRLW